MERRTDAGGIRQTKAFKVGATSTAFLFPVILATAYLNMGQTCCGGNCPPPPPAVSFVVTNNTNGTPADGNSFASVASSDGTRIAFTSHADNLGAPSDGAAVDVFVHNSNTKETTWVGLPSSAFTFSPALTALGAYVVFTVADPAYQGFQVGALDASGTDQTINWIFTDNAGFLDPQPTISGDGRYVAFATNWAGWGDTNGLIDIYVRDQFGGVFRTGEVFGDQYGLPANSPQYARNVDRLVYQLGDQWIRSEDAPCLVPFCAGTTFPGTHPSISDDGARIVYRHVWPGKEGAIYLGESGLHQIVSADSWGQYVTQGCDYPVISGDGRFVAFQCADPMTSHGGYNQVYVRDLVDETTMLASISPSGEPANQGAIATALSFDGSAVILESSSTNLGTIAAGTQQVFRVPASYWEESCVPSLADETTCNGIDDNCDGQIDEDFVPYETTCGVGACTAIGMATACNNGTPVITCTPGAPTGLPENFCNGVDDDCNGQVDEDADCVCYGNPSCDDGNPCTTDSCEPYVGCQNTPATPGDSCNDGDGECSDNGVCQCLEPEERAICDEESLPYTQTDARGFSPACQNLQEWHFACFVDCNSPGFLGATGSPLYCQRGWLIRRNPGIMCDPFDDRTLDDRTRVCEPRESP